MAPEQFINALVPGRIVSLFSLRTGMQQCLDDGNIVNATVAVHYAPGRLTQNSSAEYVLCFERRFSFQERLDDIQVPTDYGAVQGRLSGILVCAQIHTLVQQEIDDACPAILTSPIKALEHLAFRRVCIQTAVCIEEALDHVEDSRSGCSLEVQGRSPLGENLASLPATVGHAAIDAPSSPIDACPRARHSFP